MSNSVGPTGPRLSPFAGIRAQTKKIEDQKDKDPADEDEEDDAGDDSDGKNKKTKKKQKAEDQEDDEDEDNPEARAARGREKARIRTVMSSPAAQRFPAAALKVALDTSLPRHAAVAMLNTMTSEMPRGSSLHDRMSRTPPLDIGAGGEGGDEKSVNATAQRILAAGKMARGEA